ncbi:MAG: phosphoribosylformylglycinamidine synthase [Phycisphaerae bacterium SM23_30]|nr:MAG: phosphoribosylformylglycinamidine synthase [Phycisphaerae bacterium SM23_30]
MTQVKVLVLRTAGTNCDVETCYAFELAGARAQRVHVNRLIENPGLLEGYQILALPGGFSYGDDIAAGRILANQLVHHFRDEVRAFIDADKLVIGICNGFQVLVMTGILPGLPNPENDGVAQQATLACNDSGKFEDRWVYLQPGSNKCVFVEPDRRIYLPVAHGEGKLCFAQPKLLEQARANGQVAFRYVDAEGRFGAYPINPNGSTDHIAGLCDATGRVLGMMPHPERHVHRTHHPHWTRLTEQEPQKLNGLSIFANAVRYFS